MVTVRDSPRTSASPLKCGRYVAPSVPKRETPKETRHHRRVHQDSKPVFSFFVCSPLRGVALFCVFTFAWGCLSCGFTSALWSGFRCPEVLRDVSVFHCPEATDCQFWGWCPFNLQRNRSSAAAQRAIFTSIYARQHTTNSAIAQTTTVP